MAYSLSHFDFINHENQYLLSSSKIANFADLTALLNRLEQEPHASYPSLSIALDKFTEYIRIRDQSWSFYSDLFPHLISWAAERQNREFILLEAKKQAKNTVSLDDVRFILANSFFLNLRNLRMTFQMQQRSIGALDFSALYKERDDQEIAAERIMFQLSYFFQVVQVSKSRTLEFERITIQQPPRWKEDQTPVNTTKINLTTEPMESSKAPAIVGFVSKDILFGRIGTEIGQQESIFISYPECYLALLFTEQFLPDEVMIIRGAKRYSNHRPETTQLTFGGLNEGEETLVDVILVDSNNGGQFTSQMIDRDLNKAWKGFKASEKSTISTSHWGCEEIFGGDPVLKFLQQICVATITGKQLVYSIPQNQFLVDFERIVSDLSSSQITVSQVYTIMMKYGEIIENERLVSQDQGTVSFGDFVQRALRAKEGDWTYSHLIFGGSVVIAAGFVWRLVNTTKSAFSPRF